MNVGATWTAARTLLAVRLDGMGDLLMTTPALRALKERPTTRSLTLLTSPQAARIARELPFIDAVIEYTAPWIKAAEHEAISSMAVTGLVERLRMQEFDGAIVFTVCTQSALPASMLLFLADIPLRAAYCRENPYALLTHWVAEPDRDLAVGVRHEVARHIALVEGLGVSVTERRLQFPIRDDAKRTMLDKVTQAGMRSDRPWLIVHPGATAPSRRYPVEQFKAVVAELAASARWQIAIAGSEDDLGAAHAIAQVGSDVVSLAGALDLAELAALLQAADVVVCNNSVAAHLCAAVGTPVVDLYALTNPQHTPWEVPHRVLSHDVPCRNCLKSRCPLGHHACLTGVATSEVVTAVNSLAGKAREFLAATTVATHSLPVGA
jgi:lipopolysaccharide heptosyltransferase II